MGPGELAQGFRLAWAGARDIGTRPWKAVAVTETAGVRGEVRVDAGEALLGRAGLHDSSGASTPCSDYTPYEG